MRSLKILGAFLFILSFMPVAAQEVYIKRNLGEFFTQTPQNSANATCFMYKNNHFKCVCRFSDNSKIWVSKPLSEFNGELGTMNDKYGRIEACSNAGRTFKGKK